MPCAHRNTPPPRPPRGKHPDAMCKKTACSSVIPGICLNVGLRKKSWVKHVRAWIASRLLLPASWWKLVRGGPIISRVPHAIWFLLPRRAHSFTRSSQHTRAHLAPRERERFPFLTPITHEVLIPYDGCQSPAVYISTTLRHPLIFLSSLPCDYSYFFFFFFFLKSPRKSDQSGLPIWIVRFEDVWMYGWMQGFASWWTGNMTLRLCWESRICASFDSLGREGKGNRGREKGRRAALVTVSEHKQQHNKCS